MAESQLKLQDRYRFVYCAFFLFGIAALLPWNFIISITGYFNFKLRNTTVDVELYSHKNYTTDLQVFYIGYVSSAGQVANVVFQLLNLVLTTKIRNSIRIISPLALMSAVMLLNTVFTKIDTDNWQEAFLAMTAVLMALLMSASAILQGALCGLAAIFPHEYTQALMTGAALSGVIASVATVVVLWAAPTPVLAGLIYFSIATAILLFTLVVYFITVRTDYARHHEKAHKHRVRHSKRISQQLKQAEIEAAANLANGQTEPEQEPLQNQLANVADHNDEDSPTVETAPTTHQRLSWNLCSPRGPIATVFREAKWIVLTVFMAFFVCLLCFPTITANIAPVSAANDKWADLYAPVCCFVVFNVCDFIGRLMTRFVKWPGPHGPLLPLFSSIRLILLPLFLFCNVQKTSGNRHLPLVFNNDIVPTVGIGLLGWSTGYFGTLGMIYGPRECARPELSEAAGAILSTSLTVGLAIGSVLSVVFLGVA